MFGYEREALLAKRFHELTFPDDLPRCLHLTEQLAIGAIPQYTVDKRFVRCDGSLAFVRVIVTAVREPSGELMFFLGIAQDIAESWEAEEKRQAAEERLRIGLAASGTGVYRFSIEHETLEWETGFSGLFGLAPGEPLSLEQGLAMIHPDDRASVRAAYEQSAKHGDDFEECFRVVRPDGSIRWLADRARVTFDQEGRPLYLTGASTDVTALVRSHEAERAARAEAMRTQRSRDDMAAVVAHDLRSPLHTIMMTAADLGEFAQVDAETQEQIDLIRSSAKVMDRLIRDMLHMNQIENGRLVVQPVSIPATALVDEAVSLSTKKALTAGISLHSDVAEGLPRVLADRARIVQSLDNLLANALKFTGPGGKVSVRARAKAGFVEFSVDDNGRGMSAEELSHVFEPYWQADRRSRQGVGLGLAIVRGIVEAHGGKVHCASELTKGSSFRFTIPVVQPDAAVPSMWVTR